MTEILNKVASLPVEELVASVTRTVKGVEGIVTAPGVQEAVGSLGSSMARLQETIGRVDANSGPVLASLKTAADPPRRPCTKRRPRSPRCSAPSGRPRP